MALPQLVKAGVSISPVVLTRGSIFPKVSPLILNQFVGVSDANTVQVAVIGSPLQTISVQFVQLTTQDATNILAFFNDAAVNYGQEEFTYVDEDSVSHTVRYLEQEFVVPEESDNSFSWEAVFTKV